MPPRWSFGYIQSRWGWTDRAYIEDTIAHFRKDQIPVDAFIYDFEWYTKKPDYKVPAQGDPNFVDFDWNPKLFPDPAAQIASYASQGVRSIGIRKPRLGNQQALVDARGKGWILPFNPHDPNGGEVRSRNLDFSRPDVRAFWGGSNRKFLAAGMVAFWNDEGETNYVEYNNWNLAEAELFHDALPQSRFWSLNRSFTPGMQRFGAAAWTGDVDAEWSILARTTGRTAELQPLDMPYSTCDIGGFAKPTTPELLTRWVEAGVFFPILRTHSIHNVTAHFPGSSGPTRRRPCRRPSTCAIGSFPLREPRPRDVRDRRAVDAAARHGSFPTIRRWPISATNGSWARNFWPRRCCSRRRRAASIFRTIRGTRSAPTRC